MKVKRLIGEARGSRKAKGVRQTGEHRYKGEVRMTITKHYTGIVMQKGIDSGGAFIVLRHTNQYGTHDIDFSIEENELDLYHVDQVATMTCEFQAD